MQTQILSSNSITSIVVFSLNLKHVGLLVFESRLCVTVTFYVIVWYISRVVTITRLHFI